MARTRSTVIALVLLAALLAATQALARDRALSSDRSAANVAAFGQAVAWSREDADGKGRLVLRGFGTPADVPARPLSGFFDPDLGQDENGRNVAVYTRCAGVSGRSCDVYEYDFERDRERKAPGASTSGCDEFAPSIWEGTIAFARSGPKRCRGLFVKGPKGAALMLDRRIASDTDIRAGRVAYLLTPDSGRSSIRVFTIRSGRSHRVVSGLSSEGERTRVSSPAFSGSYLYWLFEDVRRRDHFVARSRGLPGSVLQFSDRKLPGRPDSIAVGGRTVYYTNGRGVHEASDPAPRYTTQH